MSLSQHSRAASSLGNSLPSPLSSHPNPLGSHPTSPIEGPAFNWPQSRKNENNGDEQRAHSHNHRREVSLPFYKTVAASESTFSTHSPNNFSTSNLPAFSNNETHTQRHLHPQNSHDSFSAALETSFTNSSFSTQLTNPYKASSSSHNLSKASTSTMSSQSQSQSQSQDHRHDSLRTPMPPGSSAGSAARRDSKSMRKLFTLAGLRSSFSTSRNSLAISDPIPKNRPVTQHQFEESRPNSGSTTSSRGVKRGAEDDQLTPSQDNHTLQPPLRKRKSESWFRRKSGIFTFGSQGIATPDNADGDMPLGPDAMMLDPPDTRPHTSHSMYPAAPSSHHVHVANSPPKLPPLSRSSHSHPHSHSATEPSNSPPPKRPASRLSSRTSSQQQQQQQQSFRPPSREAFSPPPTLPELGNLGGGFGEDTDMFANIGR